MKDRGLNLKDSTRHGRTPPPRPNSDHRISHSQFPALIRTARNYPGSYQKSTLKGYENRYYRGMPNGEVELSIHDQKNPNEEPDTYIYSAADAAKPFGVKLPAAPPPTHSHLKDIQALNKPKGRVIESVGTGSKQGATARKQATQAKPGKKRKRN